MSLRAPTSSDYDEIYRQKRRLTILDDIAAGVICDSDISELRCTGFLGSGDRDHYRDLLNRSMAHRRPTTLLDLGCGTGLLSAWMAEQLNADLIGIDFSPVAVSLARRLTSHLESNRKTFKVASFDSTGLDDCSITAVFSLDALYLSEDPVAALREVQRVMVPGASLVFTYYVESLCQRDWPLLTRNAGLDVLSVKDVTSNWREHMQEKHSRRWTQRDAIRKQLGRRANSELSVTVAMLGLDGRPSYLRSTFRYVLHAIRS